MVTTPGFKNQPASREEPSPHGEYPPDNKLPENSKENLDAKLDHAIEETFPTSDPISVTVTKGGAIDYDDKDRASAAGEGQSLSEQDTAGNLLDQVRETLRDATATASETAREAYTEGRRYVRQAGRRYPDAERYYQEGSRALNRRMTENPWLSLVVAGAAGYALAWMIHGRWRNHDEHLPDYARTQRSHAPYRRP